MYLTIASDFPHPMPVRAGLLFAVVGAHLLVALTLWAPAATFDVVVDSQVLTVEWIAPSASPAPVMPPQPEAKPEPHPVPQPVKAVPVAAPVPVAEPAVASEAVPAEAMPAESVPAPQAASTVEPPRFDAAYLRNPPPLYPAVSRRMGEEGRVLLRVRVSDEGRALQVEISQSSGSARLDRAAELAVRDWRFIAAQQGGRSVPAWVIVPINFSLKD